MIKLIRQVVVIVIVIFSTAIASADSGTFYINSVGYHGPIYTAPDGSTTAGCYNNPNWWVYESDHFLIYSDISSDATRVKLAQMSETEFATVKSVLGVTDADLGINTAVPSTKLHICSDGVGSNASGGQTGVSTPALDGTNNDPLDMLYCYAGYRNTLRHEMVHVVHGILANDNLSGAKSELWFSEGLAVYLSGQSNLSDTVSLAAYFTAGRPNPVSVKTRQAMNDGGWTNSQLYPAYALAIKYLFDSAPRGGAGNSVSSLKSMFQQIGSGTAFTTAFANTFSRSGASLSVATYAANFQSWMTPYLGGLETPATVTGADDISMVGIFKYRCDMILGIGATVTPSGTFALNVSELTDGRYALCFMTDVDTGAGLGPAAVTVSGGTLIPTSYNVSAWSPLSTTAIIPQQAGATGGTGTISVTSSDVCTWAAASNDPWITITSGSSGSGNGTVSYSVAANATGSPRTGTMTIDGQTFPVEQDYLTPSLVYADYASYGLFAWNGSAWTQINPTAPISMVASGSALYATYAGYGLFAWDGTAWTQINPTVPAVMVAGS